MLCTTLRDDTKYGDVPPWREAMKFACFSVTDVRFPVQQHRHTLYLCS